MLVILGLAWATHAAAGFAAPASRPAVATLRGQPIYLDEFQPPAQWQTWAGKTDAERAASLRDWQLQHAYVKIWAALMERFCEHRDCEPTEEEYQAFETSWRRRRERHPYPSPHDREPVVSPQEYERIHAELQKQLQEPGLAAERRTELETTVTRFEELKDKKLGEPTRDFARTMIRGWKFDRALYRQYGGTVVGSMGGLTPLGAYKAWLEENERNGALVLLDTQLKEYFWRDFKSEQHDIVTIDEKWLKEMGLKDPFEKPWWLLEPPAGDHDPHVGREPALLTPH